MIALVVSDHAALEARAHTILGRFLYADQAYHALPALPKYLA